MTMTASDPVAHTSPWAIEENFWLEGPNFYRANMAEGAEMWFPDRDQPRRGQEILDALENAPRWENVVFSDKKMEVGETRVTLRYTATAMRDGQDVYAADCMTVYSRTPGGLRLVEHRQRALG